MSEKLGPLLSAGRKGRCPGKRSCQGKDFSEEVAAAIDQEESAIIKQCYERAK